MAINITDLETVELVRRLSALTNESITTAINIAVRERDVATVAVAVAIDVD